MPDLPQAFVDYDPALPPPVVDSGPVDDGLNVPADQVDQTPYADEDDETEGEVPGDE